MRDKCSKSVTFMVHNPLSYCDTPHLRSISPRLRKIHNVGLERMPESINVDQAECAIASRPHFHCKSLQLFRSMDDGPFINTPALSSTNTRMLTDYGDVLEVEPSQHLFQTQLVWLEPRPSVTAPRFSASVQHNRKVIHNGRKILCND